jgi:hypothetical protein
MSGEGSRAGSTVFAARLTVGLWQGLLLYLLYLAFDDKVWPATNGLLFAPMVAVCLYVPLLIVQALGNIRRSTLIVWTLIATLIAAFFATYDIWHGWPTEMYWSGNGQQEVPRLIADFATMALTAVFLFIAQALVIAGDSDRKVIANYATHFDVAWKQGLQLALAGVFVGIFWALLFLGAALFNLIHLDFLERLIEHRWFAIPATTLAIAAAFHITDGRSVLVRGARTLVLALFSWLLPLLTLIGAGFLAALFFTGLDPLWNTRMATSLLLVASAWLVMLINAAYQDGDKERAPVVVLKVSATVSGLLLIPIVALAGYAVFLRIAQYGWSSDRIVAVAAVVIATANAVGYAIAALWRADWFKPLERWNFWTALLVLGVIAALLSPLADPARIAVASQVARLESGKIAADKFDFYYLHREGGRFGKAALEKLATSKNSTIATAAKDALERRYVYAAPTPIDNSPKAIEKHITVLTPGAKLPASFLGQTWTGFGVNPCLTGEFTDQWTCKALIKNLDGSGDAIILIYGSSQPGLFTQISIYRQDAGVWRETGSLNKVLCPKDYEALIAGRVSSVAPVQRDLVLEGHRWVMSPPEEAPSCP